MDMKRFFWGFIMMIAVAMVGCNGNGGGTPGTTPPTPPPPKPANVDLTDLLTGYLMIPASGLEFTIKAGETKKLGDYVVFSCPSGGADCMVTVTRNADGTIMGATSSGGMATAAPSQMAKDANAGKVARIQSIGKHHAANVPSSSSGTLPALPLGTGAMAANTEHATQLTLAAGGQISVVDGGDNRITDRLGVDDKGDDDTSNIPDATEFMKQADPALPPIPLTGWTASVHQRKTTAKITDTLTVYQNNMPEDQAFNAYYTDASADYVFAIDTDDSKLTFDGSEIDKESSAYFMGAGFPTTDGSFITTPADDDDTANVFEDRFKGTFRGIEGTYECISDGGCTVRRSGDLLVFGGDEWTFTPKTPADKLKGVVGDTDYLAFGYWVRTTSGTNGMTYDVAAFGQGSMRYDDDTNATNTNGAVAAATGTATYAGPAAGLFATRTFATDGTSTITNGGEFTAKVNLTANFGGQALAFDKQFRIMGTVKDFMDSTGKIIDSNWMLNLDRAMLATKGATEYTEHTGNFDGTTSLNDRVNGVWKGTFYGSATPVGGVTPQPSSVAGQFGAKFSNGEVLGGFGAPKQ